MGRKGAMPEPVENELDYEERSSVKQDISLASIPKLGELLHCNVRGDLEGKVVVSWNFWGFGM
jgi:hypothetical protein